MGFELIAFIHIFTGRGQSSYFNLLGGKKYITVGRIAIIYDSMCNDMHIITVAK